MFAQELNQLTLNSTLANLPSHNFQVSLTTLGEVVAQEFKKNPKLPGVMITATDGQLMGMISKTLFLEWLSRPYGVEIFLRRPIESLCRMIAESQGVTGVGTCLDKCLVVSATCSINDAVELALKRPAPTAYQPIVIELADGQHRLLDMQVLLLAQSQLFDLAKQAADAANKAKSEFLANMSHELRTPLNAILGFTQVMSRDSSLSTEQQQHLDIISRSGEHLLELINDILEMSKIEAGRVTFNKNSFDLQRLLDSLKDMLQLKALSKGLQLIVDYTSDVPQYVQTDERKLREILINLLGNAIKFTQTGTVTLRVSAVNSNKQQTTQRHIGKASTLRQAQGKPNNKQQTTNNKQQTIHFEVEDTGPGIAPEEVDKLFTTFGQTETGRKSLEGTGLGLAISQKFVHLMGGDITVSSTLDKGTTFAFDIQLELSKATEIKIPQESRKVMGLAPNQPNYRILVVEDQPANRLLLVKMLTSVGFEVYEAENGKEAIALWSKHSPHLIFMDMRMPVMDGYEATKRIKSHLKGQATVIIALTASALEQDRIVILSAGCDDFMRKPFREEVLVQKIAQHLGVRYLYEESGTKEKKERIQGELRTDEMQEDCSNQSLDFHLSQMPRDWVAQLHEAALKCLDHVIIQLIEQIPAAHAPLANTLEEWANNFLFNQVIDLIQSAQARESKLALSN